MPQPSDWRDAAIREAETNFRPQGRDFSYDRETTPRPVGHAQGVAVASRLTTRYREEHRSESMDVTPRQVKQVVDLMRPSNRCHEAILAEHHRLDPQTGHRIPTLEAALAAKYAALVSPHRHWDRKQQDAVDLRGIMLPNQDSIDRDRLRELGDLVFPGGGDELLEFLQLAIDRKPFPV